MMDKKTERVLDEEVCRSCEHSFHEKNRIIEDLKRDLLIQKDRAQNLENEVKNVEEILAKAVEEKNNLLQQTEQFSAVKAPDAKNEKEKERALEILQDQLLHLEEEKKYLSEKIQDFEHETAGLARMFGMQQEKFEYEMKNREKTITSANREIAYLEEELKTAKTECKTLTTEAEFQNELVENLRKFNREKEKELSSLSDSHDESKKLITKLKKQLSIGDRDLKTERSKNANLAEDIYQSAENIKILTEENKRLKTENRLLNAGQTSLSEEKSRVEIEVQRLNNLLKSLNGEIEEIRKKYVELGEKNAEMQEEKNDVEKEVRKMKKNNMEFQSEIQKLKKEIVLGTDHKTALESKVSLVQEEMKSTEGLRKSLQQELLDSQQCLEKTEGDLERLNLEKTELKEEADTLEKIVEDLKCKIKEQDECLKNMEESLENETEGKERLEEEVKDLNLVINNLKSNIGRESKYLEETKRELDSAIAIKQTLLLKVEKVEVSNENLKTNMSMLSHDFENLHGACAAKTKEVEALKESLNEKSRIITSLEKKEKELQNHIEELTNIEEISASELKNAKNEIIKLKEENDDVEKKYEKATLQLHEHLQKVNKKDEMNANTRALFEKQVEELSRFREHNGKINDELRKRNDDITLLTVEKDEIRRELESTRNIVRNLKEKHSSVQLDLTKKVKSMNGQIKEFKENEKEVSGKLAEAKKKLETALRQLGNEREKIIDLESELKYNREKSDRWKKVSFEIKEERNRLQMQIAELDRDLNEKHSNLAEKKSSLEKEMDALKNVIKRLKSNEDNLRKKIEELREDAGKLSDINSEQEVEIRKLSWEKEKLARDSANLKSFQEETIRLQSEYEVVTCENTNLKHDVDVLQEKAKRFEDDNKKLEKKLRALQDHFDVTQQQAHEATQECKLLKTDRNLCQENNAEIKEEKERLFNENLRLKEKKNKLIQEKYKLQETIESFEKSRNGENDAFSRQNALLENELTSRQLAIRRLEEKEMKLLNEIKELNEKIVTSSEEYDKVNGSLKKAEGENLRLRKKTEYLTRMVEEIELEKDTKVNLETELHGKEQVLNNFKENKMKLNDLITTLYQEQSQLKIELRNKDRDLIDRCNELENERSERFKLKEIIRIREEEIEQTKAREINYNDKMEKQKKTIDQIELVLARTKEERDGLKEISKINDNEYCKKIEEQKSEKVELFVKIEKLQNEKDQLKMSHENLNLKLQNLEEEMESLTETNCQLNERLKQKDEKLVELIRENNTWENENKQLQEQAENIDSILILQRSAQDQTSDMQKEISVLHDTLTQLRTSADMKRAENDGLKEKLKIANNDKMKAEIQLSDVKLQQDKLEGKNIELSSNYNRLQSLVQEGVQLKLEKEEKERLLESEKQRNCLLQEKFVAKSREIMELEKVLEKYKDNISENTTKMEKLKISNEGLVASVKQLTRINDEGVKELQLTNEKNEQLVLEKKRLTELVAFHKEEIENLRKESDEIKGEMHFKIHEMENEKIQLQSNIKINEESLERLTKKNRKLQESLKNMKDEIDDLENENEDFVAEVEQLKEINKKAKALLCSLQTEHNVVLEELREKENVWTVEKEKNTEEVLKLTTDISKLNKQLTKADEQNETLRDMEKILRSEIEELSDNYVELEEEVQLRNDEILSLKEKKQKLSLNIEELELARDTACLLKEKRQCELLKAEKNAKWLEKLLKEKQMANENLRKELDSVPEKERYLELQIISEKELSGQRLKEINDLLNSQRKMDERLWKASEDTKRFEAEIETWRVSSDSMKVRIETLEDELNKTVNEERSVSTLYEETKKAVNAKEEQIRELRNSFGEKTSAFETIFEEMKEETTDLKQRLVYLEERLEQKSVEVSTLEELLEGMSSKYESSLLVTTLLHDDIERKDERIANLENRKRQMTNLLADLDSKIAEIQEQVMVIESDNDNLKQKITIVIKSEECLRKTLEEERRVFGEKCESDLREIHHLKDTKDHLTELVSKTVNEMTDKNNTLKKLQADLEQSMSENNFLNKTKESLKNELWETKAHEDNIKQSLNVEKNKTSKQNLEIEELSNDCQSLKTKCSTAAEELREMEKNLEGAKKVCHELESCLEEKNAEAVKIQKNCENLQKRVDQLENKLFVSIARNEEALETKNEEIQSLISTLRDLKNVIDEVKTELEQKTSKSGCNEVGNSEMKEKLEQNQNHLNDLEVSHEDMLLSKDSREVEKKGLLTTMKIAKNMLKTLKSEKKQLSIENDKLRSAVKKKQQELDKLLITFQTAQQKFNEKVFDLKETSENLLVEKQRVEQKVIVGEAQLKETTIILKETQQRLDNRREETQKSKMALQNSIFERNCRASVNSKVCKAMDELKSELSTSLSNRQNEKLARENDHYKLTDAVRNETHQGNDHLTGHKRTLDERKEYEYDWESKFVISNFDLQHKFLAIQSNIHNLRTLVSERDEEISHLKISLHMLRIESEEQCTQLSNYVEKFEDEYKKRKEAFGIINELKLELQRSTAEKNLFAAASQEKMSQLENEIRNNEFVVSNLREYNVRLESKVNEIKTVNENNEKQVKMLKSAEATRKSEVEVAEKVMKETVTQIFCLEEVLHISDEKADPNSWITDENNRLDRYKELSSQLTVRFQRVLKNSQSRSDQRKKLETDLSETQAQCSLYWTDLRAAEETKRNLNVKCQEYETKLLLISSKHKEALSKITQLSESLIAVENTLDKTRLSIDEENLKISEELQQLQKELVIACERFKCSFSKVNFLEEQIVAKENRMTKLEESLKITGGDNKMLQMHIEELETATEIILNANQELEDLKIEMEKKVTTLQVWLQQERDGRCDDVGKREATIRQLELKLEMLERQVVKYKELLDSAKKNNNELQTELNASNEQYKETEANRNASILNSTSKILQLQQNISGLDEKTARLQNDKDALNQTNENLLRRIFNLEKENKECRNFLKQEEEEKEIQKRRLGKVFDEVLNEDIDDDFNNQCKKLEKVIAVIAELKRCRERCTQQDTIVQNLKENVETCKVNEYQQKYLYQVLEKEKEDLENDVVNFEEGAENLAEKLNESVNLLLDFNLDTILDNSCTSVEHKCNKMNSELFDSGFLSFNLDTSITLPASSTPENKKASNEKMRNLEIAVATCVQQMSRLGPSFYEREKLFSNKQQQLVQELQKLKQTSVQNEELISSLENEVERLEISQALIQETYVEKDKILKEYQIKLEHSTTIAKEKEKSITMLNETVEEYRKRQEALEKKLDAVNHANELLSRERLQTAITITDHEKSFEELRLLHLESDSKNEKMVTCLRSEITKLENQIIERENEYMEARNECESLRGTLHQLREREEENSQTIISYEGQVKGLKIDKSESTKRMEGLSQELKDCKEKMKLLNTKYQETQENLNDVHDKLQKTNIDLNNASESVFQLKEENVRVKLERDSLIDEAEITKALVKKKECQIKEISSKIIEKNDMLKRSETKLGLIKEFLEEITTCKDRLETDVDGLRTENDDLTKSILQLENKDRNLLEKIKSKNKEIEESANLCNALSKENSHIKREFETKNVALKEKTNELRLSLEEAKRLCSVVEYLNNLLLSNTNSTTTECQEGQEEMNTYNLVLFIGKNMSKLTLACQHVLVERQNLQKSITEQKSFLESERNENSTLKRSKELLNNKMAALYRDLEETKSSLRKREQDLNHNGNVLHTEKQRSAKLLNENSSLKERTKELEVEVLSISTHFESLKMDRNSLKESLLKAQNLDAELTSKHEQLRKVNEELRTAKLKIDELNYLKNDAINAKDDIKMELSYSIQRVADLEKSKAEQITLLNEAQFTLTQERERIVTLTKLARIKEHDLENAKMAIRLKDELVAQLKVQIEETEKTSASSKEELANIMKQLTKIQQQNESLSNEKDCLQKNCTVLRDKLQHVEKEKQTLEMNIDSERKNASVTLEKTFTQKDFIAAFEDEVKLLKHKCEQLDNEKDTTTQKAKEAESQLSLEYNELLENAHAQNKNLENNLLHLENELNLSESLRRQLETRVAESEVESTTLQDKNFQLQAEIETLCDTIKEISKKENKLAMENKNLKVSVKSLLVENKQIKNCQHANEKQQLEMMKKSLAETQRENQVFQQKLLSGKEIVNTLRNVALRSKTEIHNLKSYASKIFTKLSEELDHEKRTVSELLEDKTNLEELYKLSQNVETNLQKDLQDAKSQADEFRNQCINLRADNTLLISKTEEDEHTMKDLKAELQNMSMLKQATNDKLVEANRYITRAEDDLHRVRSAITKIGTRATWMQTEIHATVLGFDTYNLEEKKQIKKSYYSVDFFGKHAGSSVINVLKELVNLEIKLNQVDSSFKHLIEIKTTLKDKVKEMTLANEKLRDQSDTRNEKIECLRENQDNLQQKNDHLKIRTKELEKLSEYLESELKRVEKTLSNECTLTSKLSNEISSVNKEKEKLCEQTKKLEETLDGYAMENAALKMKKEKVTQEARDLSESLDSLKASYMMLRQEKRKSDKVILERKEQILAMENDLKSSVEHAKLVEKQYAEEKKSNSNLQEKLENLGNQVYLLENTLRTSRSEIEEMHFKVKNMSEENHHTVAILSTKETEITRLCEEQKLYDEKLKNSYTEVQTYKMAHEDALKSMKQKEEKLTKTTSLLEELNKLLQKEKQATKNLITENERVQQKQKLSIDNLQEQIEHLTNDLSGSRKQDETTKESLDSARDNISALKHDLKHQLLKIDERKEKQQTTNEELSKMEEKYNDIKILLDHDNKANEDLNKRKQEFEETVEIVISNITHQCQKNEEKCNIIKNLETHLTDDKIANAALQGERQELQENYELLKKLDDEKEKRFDCALENKNKKIEQMSNTLAELQSKIEELRSALRAANTQINKYENFTGVVSDEISTLLEVAVKSSEVKKKSCDEDICKESFTDVSQVSKMTDVIRSLHAFMQEHNESLNREISELNEKVTDTEQKYEASLIEISRLQNDMENAQKENDIIQIDRSSLAKALERCQRDVDMHRMKIKSLEDEVYELKQQEKDLQSKLEDQQEASPAFHTKTQRNEKMRVCLEENIGMPQSQLGNTIIQLKNAKTHSHTLESKNSELTITKTCLRNQRNSLLSELDTTNSALSSSVIETRMSHERLSLQENDLKILSEGKYVAEKEKEIAEKHLDEKEYEFLPLKDNLKELEIQNETLENQGKELKELKKQFEKDKEDLQLSTPLTQAGTSQLKIQIKKVSTSLEEQSQLQSERDAVRCQLMQAEKGLKILMEDNADLKHEVHQYSSLTLKENELFKTRCQISELRRKVAATSQENKSLIKQLEKKSQELQELKLNDEEKRNELEKNREKMRQCLSGRDKWEEEAQSVISEIDPETKSVTYGKNLVKNIYQEKLNNVCK